MSLKTDKIHLPLWMKSPLPHGKKYSNIKNLIEKHNLHTICSSGNCPNRGECWSAGTATFMILGDKCTRNCRFCYVNNLLPDEVDWHEPKRLANTINKLGLKHCVITSVARDDLNDQGALFWAYTIKTIKQKNPGITMEVLIPDFDNRHELLDKVISEKPEVISHNIETIKRISPKIRSHATYDKSLEVLRYIAASGIITKSGFMVGLGEYEQEVFETMQDLFISGVKVLTIGQYLQPTRHHIPVEKYYTPGKFSQLKGIALDQGFREVESGPFIRSSYGAQRMFRSLTEKNCN